jgi:outer membrane biogenesis lipoprotein LolB
MKTNRAITALAVALLASTACYAAKSPAMEACSNQWQQMKSSGETQGKTAQLLEPVQQEFCH